MRLILESPSGIIDIEIAALVVNLVANKRNAELICDGGGLKLLMKRAIKFKDPLLFKMLRNVSQHKELQKQFVVNV